LGSSGACACNFGAATDSAISAAKAIICDAVHGLVMMRLFVKKVLITGGLSDGRIARAVAGVQRRPIRIEPAIRQRRMPQDSPLFNTTLHTSLGNVPV